MTKKRWINPKQFFIVFSPEGETPPLIVHPTHAGALFSAWAMAKLHPGKTFFVMGSMSRPCLASGTDAEGSRDAPSP